MKTTTGLDGTFAFFNDLSINTYWARTRTAGLAGEDTSYRAQLDYAGDRYGVQAEHVLVGEHFNPAVGAYAARKLDQSAARKVIHLKGSSFYALLIR